MGCDIHWILERRHADGTWTAVASKMHLYRNAWTNGRLVLPPDSLPEAVLGALSSGRADIILPARAFDDDGSPTYADIAGEETGHQKAARHQRSTELADWRADPGAVRLVLYYDN